MTRSTLIAILLGVLLAAWVASGLVFDGGEQAAADRSAAGEAPPFAVVVRPVLSEDFTRRITIRGRTEAVRAVTLRSEIEGTIVETPVEAGARVAAGDLVCRLATNEREANVARAEALLAQRRLEDEAVRDLAAKGHRSPQQVAAARAAAEAAEAELEFARVALANTRITAPFAAIVADRLVEVGDYLQKGGACARLVAEDPFLAVGEVSERDVAQLALNGAATVRFTDGSRRDAHIRYVSPTASERTRTFRVEAEMSNPGRDLREGLTVDIEVPVAVVRAHHIPASALVLNAEGAIGVRLAEGPDEDATVRFAAVEILGQDEGGLWVDGLSDRTSLIVVGQDFVSEGQRVRTVAEGADRS
ncbi:MAG: efflux RND transporter periplasmic adaptor subunit [Rhodothalassiaceae bacterium]